ncbi:MAG TPA: polysaccharide deacetylase family protein [Candidatus Limnocylindrales bacterium]
MNDPLDPSLGRDQVASGGSAFRQRSVPILMYHQITPDPDVRFRKYAMTPGRFALQMRWLAVTGHRTISIDDLLAHRRGELPLPARPVLLTFDDGFQDTHDHAIPILHRHGFTAVFYLVTGLVGQHSRWLEEERGVSLPLHDWSAARRIEELGFRCGSHSVSHPRLAEVGPSRLANELEESRAMLEDELGRPVLDLAYPHGSYDERVIEAARTAGYRTACSVRIGSSRPADDVMALHRIPIGGHESFPTFLWRLRTGRSPREWLRRRTTATRRGAGVTPGGGA